MNDYLVAPEGQSQRGIGVFCAYDLSIPEALSI
jgi:hypothetical protein